MHRIAIACDARLLAHTFSSRVKISRSRRYSRTRGAALEDALERGEQRLALASHYGIAYERIAHAKLAGGGNKDVEVPSTKAFNTAVARAQFPVNPANAAARAKARARRGAVANAERRTNE